MSIPKWLNSYIGQSDLKQIEKAVREAENKTRGELVPVVVRRSSTIGHVPVLIMALIALLFFVFDGDELQTHWVDWPQSVLIFIDFILLFGIVRILAPLGFVERMLTSKNDQKAQVEQRALVEFYNHKVDKTKDSTGILILVSLMERQVVVLGDESISQKLPPQIWQEVIAKIQSSIKSKNLARGIIDGLEMSGDLLAEHFPIQADDTNELENHLIILE